MADTKISGLTADTAPTADDLLVSVNDPGGTPGNKKVTVGAVLNLGGQVLVEQHTASSSAQLDFTTAITATYDEYVFELLNIVPATDGADFTIKLSADGGSTFIAGTTYRQLSTYANTNNSTGVTNASEGTSLWKLTPSIKNTASIGMCGFLNLYNPGGAAATVFMVGQTYAFSSDTGHDYAAAFYGRNTTTSAVNAVRFVMSSGNIASGIIRCYGVVK